MNVAWWLICFILPLQDAVLQSIDWKPASYIFWAEQLNRFVKFQSVFSFKHDVSIPVELIPCVVNAGE